MRRHWRNRLGDDYENTQEAALYLAWGVREMGNHAAARVLDEDTLARRRVLGDDHPDTLSSASNLALDLDTLGETDSG